MRADGRFQVVILSTPKTGNTWLMNLLSAMYDLPKLGLVCPFDRNQASKLGDRWILFHHFLPETEILDWIEETQPFVLTTIRNPGDVLVSLYHHLRGFQSTPEDVQQLREMLHQPFERRDIWPPASHTFDQELLVSICWIRTGLTRVVRYEDLRRNTMPVLRELAEWLGPVAPERIEQAIDRCDIDLMRSLAGEHSAFFRSGAVGAWRNVLSPEIIEDFQSEPYVSQFAELGYSLLAEPDVEMPPVETSTSRNPFRGVMTFDNGVNIAPTIIDLYLSLSPSINKMWPPVASTGAGSYYAWLNEACTSRGEGEYSAIHLSNLVHFIYGGWPDLGQAFPNLSGISRPDFAEWMIRHGEARFKIPSVFLADLRRSYVEWGMQRCSADRVRRPWWPTLTNFALHVYRSMPGLTDAFPDVYNRDRWDYLQWIVRPDHGLPILPEILTRTRRNLSRLGAFRRIAGIFVRSRERR